MTQKKQKRASLKPTSEQQPITEKVAPAQEDKKKKPTKQAKQSPKNKKQTSQPKKQKPQKTTTKSKGQKGPKGKDKAKEKAVSVKRPPEKVETQVQESSSIVTKLLVNADEPEECRVALLENGKLESFQIETVSRTQIKGNIYKGKIVSVEPNLQAAFVDIGTEKNGFLPFGEIHPEYYYKEAEEGELEYSLITHTTEASDTITATGRETVEEKASGRIIVYNNHSSATQRLIKNTRFESPEGLIFRINESVEIPGMTKSTDGEIVPGVISAEVFADGTGEQYNIDASQFTIPGLKGTDQYEDMYAESTANIFILP